MNFNKTQKRRELLFEQLKRKHELKVELKWKICNSLITNKNQKKSKIFFLKNFFIKKLKTSYNKQQNRCLFTGRIRGFQQITLSSRHMLKYFSIRGKVQNLYKKSW